MSESDAMSRLSNAVPVLAFTVLLGCTAEPAWPKHPAEASAETRAAPQATTLLGQLLLPGEGGRRGVELHLWVTAPDGETQQLWVFPDAEGSFAQTVSGELTGVRVYAGSEVHRVEPGDLPSADDGGRIDLGVIDLREALVARRTILRAAEGEPGGAVRIGLWIGPPHTGPRGELPSLGSKQFPTVELGSTVEWLLPPDASAAHFLVERPDGTDHATSWRSGEQHVFGPYELSAFPVELVLD